MRKYGTSYHFYVVIYTIIWVLKWLKKKPTGSAPESIIKERASVRFSTRLLTCPKWSRVSERRSRWLVYPSRKKNKMQSLQTINTQNSREGIFSYKRKNISRISLFFRAYFCCFFFTRIFRLERDRFCIDTAVALYDTSNNNISTPLHTQTHTRTYTRAPVNS